VTATNHSLTGAIIAASIANPLVALPLALLSHYVLDALPHFGKGDAFIATKRFKVMLMTDAALCFILVLCLAITHTDRWWIVALGAFLAASPDLFLINLYRYAKQNRLKDWHPNMYTRFAGAIQWFERPIGAVVEAAWFVAAVFVLIEVLQARG
jgi:hypothetical protein